MSTNVIKDLYISFLLENKYDMIEMYKTVKIILSDEKTYGSNKDNISIRHINKNDEEYFEKRR
jgi:inorganic pyrophosphatase/exopolyphosphatase